MEKEDLLRKEMEIYEEGIDFNGYKIYEKVKEYLNNNPKMSAHAGDSGIIYMTNHLNPNQVPKGIFLQKEIRGENLRGTVFIEKRHPLGEQIRKDLERIILRKGE